jgi:hypothetical protein
MGVQVDAGGAHRQAGVLRRAGVKSGEEIPTIVLQKYSTVLYSLIFIFFSHGSQVATPVVNSFFAVIPHLVAIANFNPSIRVETNLLVLSSSSL